MRECTPEELAFFRLNKEHNELLEKQGQMVSVEFDFQGDTLKVLKKMAKDMGVSIDDVVSGALRITLARLEQKGVKKGPAALKNTPTHIELLTKKKTKKAR